MTNQGWNVRRKIKTAKEQTLIEMDKAAVRSRNDIERSRNNIVRSRDDIGSINDDVDSDFWWYCDQAKKNPPCQYFCKNMKQRSGRGGRDCTEFF